jgi:hypothetical protein
LSEWSPEAEKKRRARRRRIHRRYSSQLISKRPAGESDRGLLR